ncbi:hypothetical protein BOX15_Mlig019242g1 [Macrostomum lignano]|uniref:PIH1_CS domain-containing protein n=2 Tax=Macrostomum lignano TaxID=282301 RepID=A0A1I8HEP4_9PLAT|nr:hypothetical protein BOX15_Mlig019242g2 [Macrostomum lignano]PAA90936.1 hypothetical protein BOX15_Mlig019242g1 [Macrostomum lignano]
MDTLGGLQALQTLLKPPGGGQDEDSDSESESGGQQRKNHYAKLNPGDIGSKPSSAPAADQSGDAAAKLPQANPNDIWHPDEIGEGESGVLDDRLDPRAQPEYEMHFRQAVSPEDMFLGTGNKTPATASCEQMVISIKLPGTKSANELNLDIREKFLDLRSARYRLGLHLPNAVDPDSGSAKFDCDSASLTIILNNKREYDFVNF